MWILVVTWMNFSAPAPNIVLEFNTQETCETARKIILQDVEKVRLRLEDDWKKAYSHTSRPFEQFLTSYCFKK